MDSGEDPLPDLQMATFVQWPCMGESKKEMENSSVFADENTAMIPRALPS